MVGSARFPRFGGVHMDSSPERDPAHIIPSMMIWASMINKLADGASCVYRAPARFTRPTRDGTFDRVGDDPPTPLVFAKGAKRGDVTPAAASGWVGRRSV